MTMKTSSGFRSARKHYIPINDWVDLLIDYVRRSTVQYCIVPAVNITPPLIE